MKTFSALMLAVAVAVANLGCSDGCPNDGHMAGASSSGTGGGDGGGTGTGGGDGGAQASTCISIFLCPFFPEGERVQCLHQRTVTFGTSDDVDTELPIFKADYGVNSPADSTVTFRFQVAKLPSQFNIQIPFPCREGGDGTPAAIDCPSTPWYKDGKPVGEQLTCVSGPPKP